MTQRLRLFNLNSMEGIKTNIQKKGSENGLTKRAKDFYESQLSYLAEKSIHEYEKETIDGFWNYSGWNIIC